MVDNPWFHALVWFLDGSVVIRARKQWHERDLGGVVREVRESVLASLDGVKGVPLMFDLRMSRNGESLPCYYAMTPPLTKAFSLLAGKGVLSLDIAYIDRLWNYQVKNVGIH